MSTIAVIPDEVLQIVPSMPRVSRPPLLSFAIFRICSWTIDSTSPGATRASMAVIASSRPPTGMKLMTRDEEQQRGEQREKEVVGELRGEAQAVVGHHLDRRPLEQLAPSVSGTLNARSMR